MGREGRSSGAISHFMALLNSTNENTLNEKLISRRIRSDLSGFTPHHGTTADVGEFMTRTRSPVSTARVESENRLENGLDLRRSWAPEGTTHVSHEWHRSLPAKGLFGPGVRYRSLIYPKSFCFRVKIKRVNLFDRSWWATSSRRSQSPSNLSQHLILRLAPSVCSENFEKLPKQKKAERGKNFFFIQFISKVAT